MNRRRPTTVIFCVPGRQFSGRFFDCWNLLMSSCQQSGIQIVVSREYDPVVYYARNRVLGGQIRLGPKQKPWNGQIPYDYMMWIDSDMVFTAQDFGKLLERDADIISGLYVMADGRRFAAVEHLDEEVFKRAGEFKFLSPEAVGKRKEPFEVGYVGLGFTMVKKGVFEALDYPWFQPIFKQIGPCYDFTSEDVGFCLRIREAGYKILVDPNVRLGHEKMVVLGGPSI